MLAITDNHADRRFCFGHLGSAKTDVLTLCVGDRAASVEAMLCSETSQRSSTYLSPAQLGSASWWSSFGGKVKVVARTWNEFWAYHWRLIRKKNEWASRDTALARFLAVKDSYDCHLKPFLRFLEDSQLDLDFAAVKAYFVHVNGLTTIATATKLNRRSAVKARLRSVLSSPDFTQQAGLEAMLRSLDYASETRAPILARTGVGEERIITRRNLTAW